MSFIAYEVSLDVIRELRGVVELLAARDGDLADQLRRAASSVPLNLSEGRRRRGRDRTYRFRIAAGSAAEALAALETAAAWGHLAPAQVAAASAGLDRILRLLWPLTR